MNLPFFDSLSGIPLPNRGGLAGLGGKNPGVTGEHVPHGQ
jgi:hypothetical protein